MKWICDTCGWETEFYSDIDNHETNEGPGHLVFMEGTAP